MWYYHKHGLSLSLSVTVKFIKIYKKKNRGLVVVFSSIFIMPFELLNAPHVCQVKNTDIGLRAKFAQYDICGGLAIFCFHRRLSHYESGAVQREKNSTRPGKHTENHLNRKCKDNESAIHNTRPLCLPRIAELYSPAKREKPFSRKDNLPLAKLFSPSRYEPTIPLNNNNNNEIRAAIHLIKTYGPHIFKGLFTSPYFSVQKPFVQPFNLIWKYFYVYIFSFFLSTLYNLPL